MASRFHIVLPGAGASGGAGRHGDTRRCVQVERGGRDRVDPASPYRSDEQHVTLTTLHQAKGLEFEVVYIANAVEGGFPDLARAED